MARLTLPLATVLAALAALAGCADAPRAKAPLGSVKCHYSFAYVDRKEEQDRILRLVTQCAVAGSVQVESPSSYSARQSPNGFDVSFVVARLDSLNDLHDRLLFPDGATRAAGGSAGGDKRGGGSQAFNAHDPELFFAYDSVRLGGQVDVVINFQVTPGAKLFYLARGEPERDITELVGRDGDVELKTSLHKGETYVYARTVAGSVERHIRINVFTRHVEPIPRDQYGREPRK